jgi:hypothetical protein
MVKGITISLELLCDFFSRAMSRFTVNPLKKFRSTDHKNLLVLLLCFSVILCIVEDRIFKMQLLKE